jgi:diguanylate cyclase (GGDEF)-like protein
MRARLVTALLGLTAIGAVLAIGFLDPDLFERMAIGEWGQATAEAVAAIACGLAAAAVRGRARLVWGLFAAGLATWALTDGLYGLAAVLGADIPEVSVFDIGWLGFYVPMLTGAFLLYLRLRPERGWQGVLDGLLLSTAVAAAGWGFVLEPAAEDASGGLTGTLVAVLYPLLDLAILVALGWVVMRQRNRAPVWLRWVAAAFAVQAAAGLAYVGAALDEQAMEVVAAATYMLAATAWTLAALTRLQAAERRAWSAGQHDTPPAWSESVPFVVGAVVVAVSCVATTARELQAAAALAGVIMAVRAIGALKVSRDLLAERDRLLVTDPLTGAYNRRFLAQETDRAFARAQRGEEEVSALALDLDGFKAVNDRFGHGAGDELLKAVSASIDGETRLGDLLCRLGGDEFLILCPSTGADGAHELAQRVGRAVRDAAAAVVPEQPVTTSIGIATFPGDAADPADLMRNADAALYAAKRGGRDRVVRFAEVGDEDPVGTVPERLGAPTRA